VRIRIPVELRDVRARSAARKAISRTLIAWRYRPEERQRLAQRSRARRPPVGRWGAL